MNGQNADGNRSSNEHNQSTTLLSSSSSIGHDKTNSFRETPDDEPMVGTLTNKHLSIECDPQFKPIETQQCTTGIECTTIINENSANNSHEDVVIETANSPLENKNRNAEQLVNGENGNVDESVDVSIETDGGNGDIDTEIDEANLDNSGEVVESEEIEENEVFY